MYKVFQYAISWEIGVLWSVRNNFEHELAGSHKVAKALAAGDIATDADDFSVVNQLIQYTFERTQERIKLFTNDLECLKSEAVLLQKYLNDIGNPFTSNFYRITKQKFAELRSKA